MKALAAGSLTPKGSVIFWDLFNDPRPITIHSGELETNLRPMDLVQKSNTINFVQIYGSVDTNLAFRNWSTEKRIKDLDITVSFRNLDNYFLTKKRFGYVFNNQGKLDQEAVTTVYHELTHAKDFLDLDGNLSYLSSASKVREGDYKIDSSGNIIEPRIYSHHSRAQLFGESVFEQTQNLGINKKEKKKKIDAIVTLILVKMTEGDKKK